MTKRSGLIAGPSRCRQVAASALTPHRALRCRRSGAVVVGGGGGVRLAWLVPRRGPGADRIHPIRRIQINQRPDLQVVRPALPAGVRHRVPAPGGPGRAEAALSKTPSSSRSGSSPCSSYACSRPLPSPARTPRACSIWPRRCWRCSSPRSDSALLNDRRREGHAANLVAATETASDQGLPAPSWRISGPPSTKDVRPAPEL